MNGDTPNTALSDADIRIGVLGVGRMGLIHCEQIDETPGLALVAASSSSSQLTDRVSEQFGIKTFSSHDSMLEQQGLDWVVISTRTETHARLAMKALAAGKNVIVEKPMTLDVAESQAIFEEARKRDLNVVVHHNRRWDTDFLLIRQILSEGTLGEVYRIESRYTACDAGWGEWGAEGKDNPWRLKRAHGGGLLNDWGPHLVDQLLLLIDAEVRSLFAKTDSRVWTHEVDDHFWAEVVFTDGRSARIEASNNHRIPLPRWHLLGTEGSLEVTGGDPAAWNFAVIRKSFGDFPEEIRIDITHPEISSGFYKAFTQAVHEGLPMPITPKEEIRVMQLLDAIHRSAKEGCSVAIR